MGKRDESKPLVDKYGFDTAENELSEIDILMVTVQTIGDFDELVTNKRDQKRSNKFVPS